MDISQECGVQIRKSTEAEICSREEGGVGKSSHICPEISRTAHMSSVEDYPNIRFEDGTSASHILHHNSSNVNTLVMTFSLKFASCKGMLWPKGIQNMQFAPT